MKFRSGSGSKSESKKQVGSGSELTAIQPIVEDKCGPEGGRCIPGPPDTRQSVPELGLGQEQQSRDSVTRFVYPALFANITYTVPVFFELLVYSSLCILYIHLIRGGKNGFQKTRERGV